MIIGRPSRRVCASASPLGRYPSHSGGRSPVLLALCTWSGELFMARERLIAGLDIGTTKTCAVLAADRPDGRLHLLAAGVAPSKGLKRGVVVSLEETSAAVQGAIEQCERIARRRIGSAVVSIAGSHIESHNTSGVTTLAGTGQDLS